MDEEKWLRAREVMARYQISKNTLYSGPLRALAVGLGRTSKVLRWRERDLSEYEAARASRGLRDLP
jgi:predicted DNA-binding transcriptional regulator AlpA